MSVAAMTIKGAAKLERRLDRLPANVAKKVVRQSLRGGAKIVLQAAKSTVPVLSGKLRASLRVRTGKRKRGVYSILVTTGQNDNMYVGDTYYGAFVHFGHRIGSRKLGDRRGAVPAQPFLTQAYRQTSAAVRSHILQTMRDKIRLAAKGKL